MKKLKAFLSGICLLSAMCVLTSCSSDSDWTIYTEDNDNGELSVVGNFKCKDIVSDSEKEKIRQKLEEKYSDVKVEVTEDSIEGLLKDGIPIKDDDDEVRAEELDSIFEVDGHSVETFVSVLTSNDDGSDFIEYEMYAYYDDDKDKYCFAEIDYIKYNDDNKESGEESETEEDDENILQKAERMFYETYDDGDSDCVYVSSDGSYLKVDTNPNDIEGGSSDYFEALAFISINTYLDLPSSLNELMEQTSAMDGRQTRTYDNITVSWKYHPDTGLEAMYELTE